MRFLIIFLISGLGCGVAVQAPGIDPDAAVGSDDAGPGQSTATDAGSTTNDGGQTSRRDTGSQPPRSDASRPVDPPDDDHGDWINEATTVGLGDSTNGAIDYAGDEDHFRFTTTAAGRYSAYTRGPVDTFCVMLSAAGRPLWEDDASGEAQNCKITEDLEAETTYIVSVRHFDPEARGAYTFHVDGPLGGPQSFCGNLEVEPGEQCDDGNRRNGDGCNERCQWEQNQIELPQGCNAVAGRVRTTAWCWQPRARAAAASHCQTVGMTLVTIDDARDNQRLLAASNRSSPWLGLTDITEEDVWVWDGRTSAFTNWNRGEPNDWGPGEDCVQMTTSGRWNDVSCQSFLNFFCEDPRD